LKHPNSVRIVGEIPDTSEFLNEADVVVMPSDLPEAFGLVAIEAFAHGRPVVASAAGGLVDIVTDWHDGWLFPPRDVGALSRILGELDRSAVAQAADAARDAYIDRFTTQRFARNWRAAVQGT